MLRSTRAWFIAAVALALSAATALADRIDGDWCSPANATMTIDGPRVVTPGGKLVEGHCDRHHFEYVVPEGEDRAGGRVNADQIDEEHIWVTVTDPAQAAPGKPQLWRRCQVVS